VPLAQSGGNYPGKLPLLDYQVPLEPKIWISCLLSNYWVTFEAVRLATSVNVKVAVLAPLLGS